MKQSITFCLSLLLSVPMLAQGPNNSGTYYQEANGLSGSTLKTKLFTIISKKTHSPSYSELLELYKKTDTRPDGCVRDWYSNITNFRHITDKAGSYQKEGDVYNREHTVPQSWGAPQADIVHVVPTDGYVNNRRGNMPFGEVGKSTYESANGYSKVGSCKTAGYSGTVFEPNDEVKGDIARIYFYMATCYESTITSWSGGGVITGTKVQPFAKWTFDMMVRWSKLDPVDDVERARNNAIAQKNVQGNRNPFVDYPGLEDYIWGSKQQVPFSYDNYDGSGQGGQSESVAQPVFSLPEGTYKGQVTVTMTTATAGATIYYTTNGVDASERSNVYTGPVTLTETTTLKAIAVKNGTTSYQTIATYTITDDAGQEVPAEGTIALNNTLFGTAFEGSLKSGEFGNFTGTENGVTIVYSLGNGSNQYINDSQIRLYQKNTLTISVDQGSIAELTFTLARETSKTLTANVGTVNDLVWKGDAKRVVFNVDDGSGNMQLSSVKVKLVGVPDVITGIPFDSSAPAVKSSKLNHVTFDLQGRPTVQRPSQRGIRIRNGKKTFVR